MPKTITQLCDEIEAGYAAEKSGLDDDMITLLVELADCTSEIKLAIQERDGLRHALAYLVQQARLTDLEPNNRALQHATQMLRPGGQEQVNVEAAADYSQDTAR